MTSSFLVPSFRITEQNLRKLWTTRCFLGLACPPCPGFIVALDNIDIHLEWREMTMSAQNRDINWVNHEMVQNRVSGNHLDCQGPKAHIGDVPNIKFLPDIHDQSRQRLNYVILVSRILSVSSPSKICAFSTYQISTVRSSQWNLWRYRYWVFKQF